jgi:hypothetical protein
MYLACTAESMLLALVCPENWSASAYVSAVTSGRGREWPQYCQFRAQDVLGRGLEFHSTGAANFKGPCFGLITFYLQGFRNCAKHTVVIICTTHRTIEKKNTFFVENVFVSCDSQSKESLFSYTALTGCSLYWRQIAFTLRYELNF